MYDLIVIKQTQDRDGLKFAARYFDIYTKSRVLRNDRDVIKKIDQVEDLHMTFIASRNSFIMDHMKFWNNTLEDCSSIVIVELSGDLGIFATIRRKSITTKDDYGIRRDEANC